jgi:hypothetical protein
MAQSLMEEVEAKIKMGIQPMGSSVFINDDDQVLVASWSRRLNLRQKKVSH